MIDIPAQLDAIVREVVRRDGPTREEVTVIIRRIYQAEKSDVWHPQRGPKPQR